MKKRVCEVREKTLLSVMLNEAVMIVIKWREGQMRWDRISPRFKRKQISFPF
jgi:hypothetical protein